MTKSYVKKNSLLFLFLFVSINSASSFAENSVATAPGSPADYCYKPEKPLFFSTSYYKHRYDEDMEEYERCHKSFVEMWERVSKMQQKSEKISMNMIKQSAFFNK